MSSSVSQITTLGVPKQPSEMSLKLPLRSTSLSLLTASLPEGVYPESVPHPSACIIWLGLLPWDDYLFLRSQASSVEGGVGQEPVPSSAQLSKGTWLTSLLDTFRASACSSRNLGYVTFDNRSGHDGRNSHTPWNPM